MRDAARPWGLSRVAYRDQAKIVLDNMLAVFAMDLMTLANEVAGCSIIFEHPEDYGSAAGGEPASLWQLPRLRALTPALTRGAFYECSFLI